MGIQEQHDEVTPTDPDGSGPQLLPSQSVSFGTALVLVAPRVVSAIGAIGLALPIAFEVPSLLRSVGAATLIAVESGKWMPVWVSLGVAAAACLLVFGVANKRGIQQLAGLVTAVKGLRGK